MLPISWREGARADLAEIVYHIAQENPPAAHRLKKRIEDSVSPLSQYPYMYSFSERVPDLREIVAHPNYLVYYHVTATSIEIVGVVHSRREYPR